MNHPSARAIEIYAFDPEDRQKANADAAHIESCARCQETVAGLRAERERFNRTRPPEAFAALLEARRAASDGWFARIVAGVRGLGGPGGGGVSAEPSILRRSLAPAALAFAAMAAAIIVTVAVPRDPAREGIALKGAETSFDLYVSHHGEPAARFLAAQQLHADDVVRFEVLIASGGFAYVACIGDDGKVSRFWPQDRPESGPVPEGRRWLLPGSVVLDDYPGEEAMVLFASDAPITDEAAADRLHAAYKAAGGRLDGMNLGPGAVKFVYRKERK